MYRFHRILLPALAFLAALGTAEAAQRAYVASYGVDGAACTLPAPCRSFAFAMTSVDAGGEIVALDAAGYGPVTITKSVTITSNPGYFAGIAASTGSAVTIATVGVKVTLRNLNINGIGATNGVLMTAGDKLSVENCVVSGFSLPAGRGISVQTPATVTVVRTAVHENYHGLYLTGDAQATVANSTFLGNLDVGLYIVNNSTGATKAFVSDSIFTNLNVGMYLRNNNATGVAKAWVTRSTFAKNEYGVAADAFNNGFSVIHLSGSSIVGNLNNGYYSNGTNAFIETANNNVINGNLGNTGSLTYIPPQ